MFKRFIVLFLNTLKYIINFIKQHYLTCIELTCLSVIFYIADLTIFSIQYFILFITLLIYTITIKSRKE